MLAGGATAALCTGTVVVMTTNARRPGRARSTGLRLSLVAITAIVAYVTVTTVQVWLAAQRDGTRSAAAIVVLGAAQYDGLPSPALRERLDHAAALYDRGLAPVLVVTGGRQPGDRFNEATAAVTYLHSLGIPDSAIRREVQGRNTWEQLAASARFLRAEGIADVVLVSHPWHAYRLRLVADEVGLEASVSATGNSRLLAPHNLRHALREVGAVAAGRIIGFRRLTNLTAP